MVQGKTKGLQSKESTGRKARHAAANTKKGQRTIAPKKSILIKQAALHKVLGYDLLLRRAFLINFIQFIGFNCQN